MRTLTPLILCALAVQARSATLDAVMPTFGLVEKARHFGSKIAQWTLGMHVDGDEASPVPRPPDETNNTLYQQIAIEPEFSKFFKLVNLNNETIDLLNSTSNNITLFAPPDTAFPKPPCRRRSGHPFDPEEIGDIFAHSMDAGDPAAATLENFLAAMDYFEYTSSIGGDDDEKRARWRALFKRVVRDVISYHVLPHPHTAQSLAVNTTYATNLTLDEGSLAGTALRIHVGAARLGPHPSLAINFFSKIESELHAANGIGHELTFPLLPPQAIFSGLFNFPSQFSIATSAIQRSGLTAELDRFYVPGEEDEHGRIDGAPVVTFFAPSNRAFNKLPPRLRAYLFSPFGKRALKKLLQFHIVPAHSLHSDYLLNTTESAVFADAAASASDGDDFEVISSRLLLEDEDLDDYAAAVTPRPNLEYNVTLSVPTLLTNCTHTVSVLKYEQVKQPLPFPVPGAQRTRIVVNDVDVLVADVPARNGAIHILGRVLNPMHGRRRHREDYAVDTEHVEVDEDTVDWQEWEEWLPQWAAMSDEN